MKVNQLSSVSTSHTVRLVPSTAMNPFGTINLIRSFGAFTYAVTALHASLPGDHNQQLKQIDLLCTPGLA